MPDIGLFSIQTRLRNDSTLHSRFDAMLSRCLNPFIYSFTMAALSLSEGAFVCSAPPMLPHVETIPTDSDAAVRRRQNVVIITPKRASESTSVSFPRLFARVRSARWNDRNQTPVELLSLPNEWTVRWKDKPQGGTSIELEFDEEPLMQTEVSPITAGGDGSFLLHAYQAFTSGEGSAPSNKLLYEPQPHKNTVGYWTVPTDRATWKVQLDEPGEFNVGILQGCGAGQGGSLVSLSFTKDDESIADLEFETLETGHFQDFRWRHLGAVKLDATGELSLVVSPTKIQKVALMDVRSISLTRLPAKN